MLAACLAASQRAFACLGHVWSRFEQALVVPQMPDFRPPAAHGWRQRLLAYERQSATWHLLAPILVAAISVYHFRQLFWWSSQTPFDFDAVHTYLPMAKELLAQGPLFLLSERALSAPPVAYMFPMLFNADLAQMRQVNMGLSVLCVLLIFRTGWLLHSRTVGVLAAAAFGLTPHFWPYMSTGSVEALYVFLLVASMWMLAEAASGLRGAFILAGVFIGLATMTRATILYWLPLAALSAWLLMRLVPTEARLWRGVRDAHLVAMLMVLPLLLKNLFLWGVPAVSTGAGIALLNGHHPLTYGFEANYFNFESDHWAAMPKGVSHLQVAADKTLAAVAKFVIADLPPLELAKMYALKLSATLFTSNKEWIMPAETLRPWRAGLLLLALPSLLALRKSPLIALVWALFAFQVAIHIPALYQHRYSVSAVDLPLALLAATGAGVMLFHARWWLFPILGGVIWLALDFSVSSAQNPQAHQPNMYGVAHRSLARWDAASMPIAGTVGFVRAADGRLRQVEKTAHIDLDFTNVRDMRSPFPTILVIDVNLHGASQGQGCERVMLFYRGRNDADFGMNRAWSQRWQQDKNDRRYVFGGSSHIRMNEPGTLRMAFSCVGATLRLISLDLVRTTTMEDYTTRYLAQFGMRTWREWLQARGMLLASPATGSR